MLALWSCGRRAGVVQAQRQIHRALRTAFTIAETVVRTIAEQPALAVPRATPASAVMLLNTIRCAALVATPSADAAVFAAARRGTEPATVPTTRAMYATALPQTIRSARSSRPRMDRADASIAWALPLL